MSKEVTVSAWCDWPHFSQGEALRVPATNEVRVAMNGGVPVLLDLCPQHNQELVDLLQVGAPVKAVKAVKGGRVDPMDTESRTCPVCGSTHATRNAMTKHLRDSHGTSIKELKAAAQVDPA